MLYTWDDPSKERSLFWNVYNKKSKGFVAEFWKVKITLHWQFSKTCYLPSVAGYVTEMENTVKAYRILWGDLLKSYHLEDCRDESVLLRWLL
jgi:hypothetical protein